MTNNCEAKRKVFRFLCKTNCKRVNWAEQITMERPKISHKIEGATRKKRNFAGISTNVKSLENV